MFKNILLVLLLITCIVDIYAQLSNKPKYSTFEIDAPQLDCKRKIWLYLPLNYDNSEKKYPLIYMHDGQYLFD